MQKWSLERCVGSDGAHRKRLYLQGLVDSVVAGDGGVGKVGAVELAGGSVANGLSGTARLLDLGVKINVSQTEKPGKKSQERPMQNHMACGQIVGGHVGTHKMIMCVCVCVCVCVFGSRGSRGEVEVKTCTCNFCIRLNLLFSFTVFSR